LFDLGFPLSSCVCSSFGVSFVYKGIGLEEEFGMEKIIWEQKNKNKIVKVERPAPQRRDGDGRRGAPCLFEFSVFFSHFLFWTRFFDIILHQ
jgi:hypothetical protein